MAEPGADSPRRAAGRAARPTAVRTCAAAGLLLCLLAASSASAGEKNEFRLKHEHAAASCSNEVTLPPPRSKELPGAVKVLPSDGGIYAGVYSIGTTREDVSAFQRKTGKPPAIVFSFHDWVSDDDFASDRPQLRAFDDDMEDHGVTPLQLARQLDTQGTVLALTWALQCCDFSSTAWWFGLRKTRITLPRLLNGDFDEHIRKAARQIRGYGKPIMLALFSEFNWQAAMAFGKDGSTRMSEADDLCGQYGDKRWPDGPERLRDAHRHVIDLFRAEGVRNVTWFMYASSGYMDPAGRNYSPWLHPRFSYPGDDYIDWVGQSAYFVDPAWGRSPSKDAGLISQALAPGYAAWGEVTQRPMFLPEFGAVGDKSLDRSAILGEVMSKVLPAMPRVKALTLADFQIAEICCQVPRLGRHAPGEVAAWRRSVGDNATYRFRVRTGAPERSTGAAP